MKQKLPSQAIQDALKNLGYFAAGKVFCVPASLDTQSLTEAQREALKALKSQKFLIQYDFSI